MDAAVRSRWIWRSTERQPRPSDMCRETGNLPPTPFTAMCESRRGRFENRPTTSGLPLPLAGPVEWLARPGADQRRVKCQEELGRRRLHLDFRREVAAVTIGFQQCEQFRVRIIVGKAVQV